MQEGEAMSDRPDMICGVTLYQCQLCSAFFKRQGVILVETQNGPTLLCHDCNELKSDEKEKR